LFELHYQEQDLGGQDESTLALCHWDGSQWVKINTQIDAANNILSAETMETGLFGVWFDTKNIYVPVIRR
jgi:hypothetical protein